VACLAVFIEGLGQACGTDLDALTDVEGDQGLLDDLADASLFLMRHYDGEEIINVGVGSDVSIAELTALIGEVVGYHGRIRYDPSKPDGTPRKLLDVTRLERLGWKAKIDLRTGLRQVYDWYREEYPGLTQAQPDH
jgi:GDP-L-fucose synthase